MLRARNNYRLLIYSHDTFGLGHLRRCRAIAHSIADHRSDVSVLILSGSPIIGSYGFRPRVDFIRFPGIIKLRNGTYTPRGLDISIEDAISIRENVIRCSAETFRPHVFLVDKEPLGLRGEVESTLEMLKKYNTRLVLGLRDILDDQDHLAKEWDRKAAMPALESIYDDIWVYGREEIYDPLVGLDAPQSVRDKMTYMGYLQKPSSEALSNGAAANLDLPDDFILVTTGGGDDGGALVDWVISAYEYEAAMPQKAFIVLGPFMPPEQQRDFKLRAERLDNVRVTTFFPHLDSIMRRASAVVAMGGYNTFCEILSADKPALIVPRIVPRLEQWIRADRMSRLGLVQMLTDDGHRDPATMAKAICNLHTARPPSHTTIPGFFDGFNTINRFIDEWLSERPDVSRPLVMS